MGVREGWIFIVMANLLTHAFSNEFMYFFMEVYCIWHYRHGKCVAPKCQTGYTSFTGKLSSFHFPPKNEELNKKWNRFVNRSDWVPTKHSILCKLHFEDIYKIKLVEETSSYNPFRRTYRYAIRSSDHSNI